MNIKAHINDQIGADLRKGAIARFTYFKGPLNNAVEEAIIQWLRRNERIVERLNFLLGDSMNEISVLARYDDMDGNPRFDISCLNSMGTMIKQEVLENGTILLSKDVNALYDFSERTIREYSDFTRLHELMIHG